MAKRKQKDTGGGTRATVALDAAGIAFSLRAYEIPRRATEATVGEAAAAALGLAPEQVFKTLIVDVDGARVCALVPTAGTLSLKVLAAAAGGKRAKMVEPAAAERLTGYVTGGISPIGQLRSLRTFIDASATSFEAVYVSAGRRGLQMQLAPEDLVRVTAATQVEGLGIPK